MTLNNTPNPDDLQALSLALAAPFAEREVKFKPQAVKGNRALALAYVDVRAIMDRLDDVLGVANWQDDYRLLPDNSVMCRLRLKMGGRWITKMDVGSPSEQPDGGDRLKAAFSDALKRAAVKFGLGRYLYRLPQQWAEYDPTKRQFSSPPKLPPWAQAPKAIAKPAKPETPKPTEPIGPQPSVNEKKVEAPPEKKAEVAPEKKTPLPVNGSELHRRLREADAEMASRGACQMGALLAHVTQAGVKAGFSADLTQWAGPALDLAVSEARAFKAKQQRPTESKTAA